MNFWTLRKILTLKLFVQWKLLFSSMIKKEICRIRIVWNCWNFNRNGTSFSHCRLPIRWTFWCGYLNESCTMSVPWRNIWLEKGVQFLRGVFRHKVCLGSKNVLFVTPFLKKPNHEHVFLTAVCFTHHLCAMQTLLV